jgi:hypothetical protein
VAHETKFAQIKSTMIMFTKMQIPSHVKHEPNILNNGGKKISNYIMCVLVCYPPQAQQNKCIPIGSMGWPHMHRERPHVVGWERPNMMCNIEENKKMV